MDRRELVEKIINAAAEVHRLLGPGYPAAVYRCALGRELRSAALQFRRKQPLGVDYKGHRCDSDLCLDFLVEGEIAVEIQTQGDGISRFQDYRSLLVPAVSAMLFLRFDTAVFDENAVALAATREPAARAQ